MEIVIRKGRTEDTEAFLALLQDVRNGMEHPEWFFLDPPEEVRKMLQNGTMQLWVATEKERIIAAFDFLLPGLDACNYGYALGFSQEQLWNVVNMDSVAVHPDYRGRGLHRKLQEAAEQELREKGTPILLCTVHPENQFSLNNVRKLGYTIQKKVEMYGSVRYILRKDLF